MLWVGPSARECNLTSPRLRGEVGLLLAMRSIVQSKSGEGGTPTAELSETPAHSNPLRASYARLGPASGARERTADATPFKLTHGQYPNAASSGPFGMMTSKAISKVRNMTAVNTKAVSRDFHSAILPTSRMKPAIRTKLAT
jgi:hypothetical protein